MSYLNKVMLVGRIGKDAHETPAGYAKFSLATSETFKNKEGVLSNSTQWHSVIVYNENLVKFSLNKLKKGVMAYVEGKINYRNYINDDGIKNSYVDVVIGNYNGDIKIMNMPKPQEKEKEKESEYWQPSYNSDSVNKYFERYS